jgi:hydrogenase maturation protein HypF
VWSLADQLGLSGWVRNDGSGVSIAIAGNAMDAFLNRLPNEAPRLARIDSIEVESMELVLDGFSILDSVADAVATAIGPDAAVCPDCVAEICDPDNRRWRYAFTTCTHCGPRYTVTRHIPYDRAQTSLHNFPLCPECAREYGAVTDRRFHAETTCCPVCGPRLQLCNVVGEVIPGDPIAQTLQMLRGGHIVALKGLGGFHLVCDARNSQSVAELRRRKQREAKPLAVMALNTVSLQQHALIGEQERGLLQSVQAPIVLCRKLEEELPGIAPGLNWLGAMLPSNPLQLLLWHEACGRPAGVAWLDEPNDLLLVMSSANPHGEPLVSGNNEAMERLAGIADGFLQHDRDIVVRCDDSVVRPGPRFIRRARGFTPVPIALEMDGPTVLALGGHLKNTVCVVKGREAYLSQHIGGLDNAAAIAFLEETVAHLLAILDVRPDVIAHDLHPDYASTREALRLAQHWGVPAVAVPHHHAHIASICAEHGLDGALLGLALDGVGLGQDGGLWGGELLLVNGAHCERLGHLRPMRLPGGDRAAREPWRVAVGVLHDAGRSDLIQPWLRKRYPYREAGPLLTMLQRNLNCPSTTSMGRLFDAAAGLLGVRDQNYYEGQAAMELEGLAQQAGPVLPIEDGFLLHGDVLDFAPLLVRLAECNSASMGAAWFHATVAHGLAHWLIAAAKQSQLTRVAVGGGCAMNEILMGYLRNALSEAGIRLVEARRVPPNDGGLALGQAWIARLQTFR